MASEGNTFTMQTPAAVLAPKQQYLNLLMNSMYKFSEICAAPESDAMSKQRVSMLCRMIIAYIPDVKERLRLYKERDSLIADFNKTTTDKTLRIENTFVIDCNIVGQVMSLMDQLLAICDRQTIMSSGDTSELENKYYPNGTAGIFEDREEF